MRMPAKRRPPARRKTASKPPLNLDDPLVMVEEFIKTPQPDPLPQGAPPEDEFLTREDRALFEKRRAGWKEDPISFLTWVLDQDFMYIQILDKKALDPQAGKASAQVSLQCIKEIRELNSVILDAIKEAQGGFGDRAKLVNDRDRDSGT